MPAPEGPLWAFFYGGDKQNSSQKKAYCLGCIRHFRQTQGVQDPPNDTDSALKARLEGLGSKEASPSFSRTPPTCFEEAEGSLPQCREGHEMMKQPELQVYRGANIPFGGAEVERLRAQFLRATVSANLPFLWTEDVEVIKLFLMFRSTACDVIPARDVISGTLLDKASADVEKKLRDELKGSYVVLMTDGWKDDQRNPITGVNVTANNGKSYLVDLIQSNGQKKDGASMCLAFEGMIHKTEANYGCIVILFCCDNDGGSQRGRKDLGLKRPWLLIAPCCAHQASRLYNCLLQLILFNQSELMLGDYLSVNEHAAEIAAEATDLIHWIISHDRVRKIFDDTQFEKNFKVLVYLIANITRWTTHYLSFQQILLLKIPLRHAAYLRRQDIIAAQIGAEKNRKAIAKITETATKQLDLIENNDFWKDLQMVVEDIEPLCYATNINQANKTRLDQVLLTFAGLFRHFSAHPDRAIAKGMMARIEKRWAALDQPIFVLCLVLNPYESLDRFGDKAGLNVFNLNTELVALFRRVRSKPRHPPRVNDEAREKQLSVAFMDYIQGTGDFVSWRENREDFMKQHPDGPHLVWQQLKACPAVADLARFALLLLGLVANQAPSERSFSDLKIKKTRLRNRLRTTKLEKMSKVGADIRSENLANGLIQKRAPREVHQPTRVASLLSVPRYADVLDISDGESDTPQASKLVKSGSAWRNNVHKWVKAAQESEEQGDPVEQPAPAAGRSRKTVFLPRSLSVLFGGNLKNPVAKPRTAQFTEEVLMMELLAAEESDEAPDDGALSGSGDDFEM